MVTKPVGVPGINPEQKLSGSINGTGVLSAGINASTVLSGAISTGVSGDAYAGEYEATPAVNEQILDTDGRILKKDIVIKPIPTYQVSNEFGGDTFIIGG